jgi:hypothetical protein
MAFCQSEVAKLDQSKKLRYGRRSVGQSVMVSSPHLGSKTRFLLLSDSWALLWATLSDERTDLSFTIAAGPRQRSYLRSESRGTHDHILLSQIRDSSNLKGQVPAFISPRNRVAQLYPWHWVPFSSPPTSRRDTVEVFEPASTRRETEVVRVTVTLPLAVYRQSVRLGVKLLECHDQRSFGN